VSRVESPIVTESQLQRALDCGELTRLYQPIVDLGTGDIRMVEALLRWDHPARGLLAPGEFLAEADNNALLVRIGWSVVIEAAARAGEWRRAYPEDPVTVSVNLFDGHLDRRDLANRVEQLLEYNEVPGDRALAFEVGERHLRPARSRTRERLTVLHNLGVEVVVDDFGAAAATGDDEPDVLLDDALELLESLTSFPLDAVKLDPRFVRRLATGERVRAVVDGAHAAGLLVVALAVEDQAMADRATRAGFDLAQGFHFARPERPERIGELLAAR
jgi:EAL domain-containing protein (putative c-di-GMP-specific phosphodiesterase class I)